MGKLDSSIYKAYRDDNSRNYCECSTSHDKYIQSLIVSIFHHSLAYAQYLYIKHIEKEISTEHRLNYDGKYLQSMIEYIYHEMLNTHS
jgi:hypothetical protein